jgi:hypothetical protein
LLAAEFQGGIVRKYLGALAGMAALCAMSWAQTPAQTPAPQDQPPAQAPAQAPGQPASETPSQTAPPEATPLPTTTPTQKQAATAPQFPRIEIFGGGSYAEAGLFNAGHWAGLPGWDASLGLNATDWLGIIVDGGQYFGTSQIPTATPAPFQGCGSPNGICSSTSTFDVSTREYNILFGLQLSRRKYERWTPFAEALYGHQGTKGVAGPSTQPVTEVSSGRALVLGGGLDYKINPRFALRFKADYLQTGSFKQTQDNFRFSVGVVIRNVHKKKKTLEDEIAP